jgi:lipopolysaccharide/colanic/teichoic acid biosynthesis glycosyltransferase/energy-coupling factor transporter ATP-binding protein EcfA2
MPRIPLNLLALGTAAVTAGTWFGTHHSVWKSALVSVSCAAVAFGQKIWTELEPQWVKRIATWLDGWASTLLAVYSKRYFKHLYFKHRTVDLRGFSIQGKFALELESLYVNLYVDSAVAREIDQDALSWGLRREPTTGKDIFAWLRAHREGGNNFAILGPPGSGKTTLLKHLALAFAARRTPHKLTPILLQLRELAHAIGLDPEVTLVQLVEQTLKELPPPPNWFERRLNKGKCLIMLDGLDEIADIELRRKVMEWVQGTALTHWQNAFLVASRPNGYRDNPIQSFNVLRVLPFDRSQTTRFIDNWYLAHKIALHQKNDAGVRSEACKEADDLREWLMKMPGLQDLAVNPLLLTLIATVHLYRSRLPGRRVELYDEICDVFLGKRQQARGLDVVLTSAQSVRVLRVLAHAMMVRELREIPEQTASEIIGPVLAEVHPELAPLNFLAGVEDSSGLFSQREAGVYSFAHLTFQEYLCSLHIKEEGQGAWLAERIDREWWHETARFYCAQADGSQIVEKCIASEPPDIRKLMLATDCEVDAFQLRTDLRQRLRQITSDAVEHQDGARRKVAAELMLARRDRNMVAVGDDRYVDSTPLSCAEYQLFIDARTEQGDFRQPDHWKSYQFAPTTGRYPIEGIRVNDQDEFCAWLTARSTSEWQYVPAERSDVSSLAVDWKKWENIDFFRSQKSSPRIAGRKIIEQLKEEVDSPWWPPTAEAVHRLASFVVWMAMSEFQTTDNRIRFSSTHVEELGLMLDELLQERRLERKTDLSGIAARTKNLRMLISELWADRSLVQEFAEALDEDVAIAHSRNLQGEEVYHELRRLRRELAEGIALDEGIRREKSPALDTFDLYRFIAADFRAFGRKAEKETSFYCLARLLEEQNLRTLKSNRNESNWGIWIARRRVMQNASTILISDLLTTISAGAKRARKRRRGGKVSLAVKRVLDVTLSAVLLVLLAPLFAAIAIAIKIGSRGPVFFRSKRVGRNARIFQCLKFRTMVVNTESLSKNLAALNERTGTTLFKLKSDPRVTYVGRFLRKFALDELPQLLNVLRGEMSLVGPRPAIASEVGSYDLDHFRRLEVLPGLTGLWQVKARQDSSFEAYIALDIFYVENRSLWLDLKILLQSIGVAFAGTGS